MLQAWESKNWPALSPGQNNTKFVNTFTYSNRPTRTTPHTPKKTSQNLFSCPTDSVGLKSSLNWPALSVYFKSSLPENFIGDSYRVQ